MKTLANGTYAVETVVSNEVTSDADFTQLITVTTAGTPVQGPNKSNPSGWVLKPAIANTGTIYVMYHGQTTATKGFPLTAGSIMPISIANLSDLDFDATVSGEKVHACKV